ncbi:serine protease 41-like [Uranotaenia lowii]|uniref:serine protease 41-like n=1 Tax=Uranotaenia lowii TaxID=190385 RepID=UPI00247B0B1E|nr:serine protease 41-like [Uranotaenia lowii]
MLLLQLMVVSLCLASKTVAESCGNKQINVKTTREENGSSATPGSWPWHGALLRRGRPTSVYVCGITIVSKDAIVTAAHCIYNPSSRSKFAAGNFYIKIGETNLKNPGKETQEHNVSEIIEHPRYDHGSGKNDLAILKLRTSINFTPYIQPICLWRGNSTLSKQPNQLAAIVGWSRSQVSEIPKDLTVTFTSVVSNDVCLKQSTRSFQSIFHENRTFCANHPNKTGFNSGDSGNGLYVRVDGVWNLRGIVAAAKYDPSKLYVGTKDFAILTNVEFFTHWISSKISLPKPANKNNLLQLARCGIAQRLPDNRFQYPWLSVLNYQRNYSVVDKTRPCGAILIHPSFLLTSGSCINTEINYYQPNLRNGTTVFGKDNKNIIPVKEVFKHPQYDSRKKVNYIALVKLESPAPYIPICLSPFSSRYPPNERLEVPFLQLRQNQIHLDVLNASVVDCSRDYGNRYPDASANGIRCVAYQPVEERECGYKEFLLSSPIQTLHRDKYYGLAVSSFGPRCLTSSISEGYTDLMMHLNWIAKTIKENS